MPKNNTLGYTIPHQNSAEIQVHIAAAQSGSTQPEADANRAIAAAQTLKQSNPTIDVMETATTLATQPEKVTAIEQNIALDALQAKIKRGVSVANQRRNDFNSQISLLKRLMSSTNTNTETNLNLVLKIENSFKTNYNILMAEAKKNGYGTRKFGTYATRLDKAIEEVANKNNQLKALPQNAIVSTGEPSSFQAELDNFNLKSNLNKSLTSNFVDESGTDRVGPPMPEQNYSSSPISFDLKTGLIAGAALLILLKGKLL